MRGSPVVPPGSESAADSPSGSPTGV